MSVCLLAYGGLAGGQCGVCLKFGPTWQSLVYPNVTSSNGTAYNLVPAAECPTVPRPGDQKFKVSPASTCAVEHFGAQQMSGFRA